MATTEKNVSLSMLQYYDGKVSNREDTKDAATLASAKSYTDTEIGKATDTATALNERVTAVETKASANETAIGVLNGDETTAGSVKKAVADGIAKIVADAPESLDTLKEISDWISSHSESAAAMNSAIATNSSAITALQTLIGSLPEGITATDIVGYIQEAVAAEKARAEGVESGLNTRLTAVESAVSDTGILAQAKAYTDELANGAVAANAAAIAAINNADTGIATAAKNYTDTLNTAMDERVKALEDVSYATESDIDALFTTT